MRFAPRIFENGRWNEVSLLQQEDTGKKNRVNSQFVSFKITDDFEGSVYSENSNIKSLSSDFIEFFWEDIFEFHCMIFFRTETRLEEFKKRFRRSGSLGVPFFPEEDIRSLKANGFLRTFSRNNFGKLQSQMAIEEDDEEGTGVVTVIVRTSKAANSIQVMLQALPVIEFQLCSSKDVFIVNNNLQFLGRC